MDVKTTNLVFYVIVSRSGDFIQRNKDPLMHLDLVLIPLFALFESNTGSNQALNTHKEVLLTLRIGEEKIIRLNPAAHLKKSLYFYRSWPKYVTVVTSLFRTSLRSPNA